MIKWFKENIFFGLKKDTQEIFNTLFLLCAYLIGIGIFITKTSFIILILALFSLFIDEEKTNKKFTKYYNYVSIAIFMLFLGYLTTLI